MTDNGKQSRSDERALEGLRVLELGQYVSAPLCAKLLGAYGAEVIKVEQPGLGDPARRIGPFLNDRPHPERSALFLFMNTNKMGITLDVRSRTGGALLRELVKTADALVENFKPGFLSGLALGYEELERINPALVMASITDFGQSGPYRDYEGGRLVDNALGGYMYLNGDPKREPLAGGGEQPEVQGGLYGYAGVLAAILARQTTGTGQHIDVSMVECMAHIHQFNINRYEYSGMIQKRVGNRYAYSHPCTIYPCADGYISVCPSMDEQAERMLIMMGMEHLLQDPRFQTGFHRLVNADAFDELVRPWFLERTRREIVETCQEWRVPAAYVNDCRDLLADEHSRARGFWTELDHPEAGRLPYASAPFKMSATPELLCRAPLLGEHNEEVFCGRLGLDREDLVRLRAAGVI